VSLLVVGYCIECTVAYMRILNWSGSYICCKYSAVFSYWFMFSSFFIFFCFPLISTQPQDVKNES